MFIGHFDDEKVNACNRKQSGDIMYKYVFVLQEFNAMKEEFYEKFDEERDSNEMSILKHNDDGDELEDMKVIDIN